MTQFPPVLMGTVWYPGDGHPGEVPPAAGRESLHKERGRGAGGPIFSLGNTHSDGGDLSQRVLQRECQPTDGSLSAVASPVRSRGKLCSSAEALGRRSPAPQPSPLHTRQGLNHLQLRHCPKHTASPAPIPQDNSKGMPRYCLLIDIHLLFP